MKWLVGKNWLDFFEIALSVIAIIMSGTSLFLALQQERRARAPNIQLESFSGGLVVNRHDKSNVRKVELTARIDLRNHGSAPASVVSVSWDPIDPAGFFPKENARLTVMGDEPSPEDEDTRLSGKSNEDPLLWLEDTVFPSGKSRTLWLVVRGEGEGTEIVKWAKVRIRLTFSNGQEVACVPDIKRLEFSVSYPELKRR